MNSDTVTCVDFDHILNFRDVGSTVNRFTGKRLLAEGLLFRSARPDDASLSDRQRLRDEYGIKTMMDLRTKTEHVMQLKKREADLKIPALIQSNAALAEPFQIPDIEYLDININGKGFERSLLWKLSTWSIIKLLVLILFGYRTQAIRILSREVMQPRGLIGLGFDSVDYCGFEIATAIREFASSARFPIVVHCTQGKDRTGLIIALLLMLLDVPLDAITYDYLLTGPALVPEKESRLKEIKEIGLTEEFAETPEDWIPKLHEYLGEKYGGAVGYLDSIAVDEKTRGRIIEILAG